MNFPVTNLNSNTTPQTEFEIDTKKPITVLADYTILLEKKHEDYNEARDLLLLCSQLERCTDIIHTYRLTPLSL